uniref:Uncharacterized protein n=1 Tax=Anguilla anguilla TaxID=7936 RepID=A0A0E9QXR8_ANGAN
MLFVAKSSGKNRTTINNLDQVITYLIVLWFVSQCFLIKQHQNIKLLSDISYTGSKEHLPETTDPQNYVYIILYLYYVYIFVILLL